MRSILVIMISILPILLMAQIEQNGDLSLENFSANDLVNAFDVREVSNVSKVYLMKNWVYGQIEKKDGMLTEKEYLLNYDLMNKALIIKLKGKMFSLPNHKMNGFLLNDLLVKRKFKLIKFKGEYEVFEILVPGELELLRKESFRIKEPKYVASLDVGSMDESAVMVESFYLKTNSEVKKIPKRKKDAIAFFRKVPGFKNYSKINNVNFKKQDNIKKMILFLNNSNN